MSVLEREVFSEAEAARLLRVAQSTLHYWLEGGERKGRSYKPVLRTESRGARSVTWAEFVEAGLLREYRRTHQVPMIELRAFIDLLREQFGVPYPLADRRPYVAGKKLVLEAQVEAGLDPEYCLVAAVGNQLLLTPPSAAFVERVTWDGDVAAGWRPDPNPQSPVRILPDVRFGRPSIKVSTGTTPPRSIARSANRIRRFGAETPVHPSGDRISKVPKTRISISPRFRPVPAGTAACAPAAPH